MGKSMRFEREPLHRMLPDLLAVARGSRPASLVVRGGTLVNVCSGELLEGMSVAFCGSRIAYVGKDVSHTIGDNTRIVEADGRFIAPGLLDGHCHIESTQMTGSSFARTVLPLGTTGGFFDPHEIANVLGLEGIRLMLEELRSTPLAAYMQAASCVPSTSPELETAGAYIGPAEVEEALSWGRDMIGLGEVMNFPGVVYGDERMLGEIEATLRLGKIADGHFTWPAGDWRLPAYAAAGISGDHENVTPEDVAERVRLGMYAKMRQGSAWHDVPATIRAFTEKGLDTRRMMLVTDDRSAESLLEEGHMDHVVRIAIRQGVKPVTAFQMATLNTAERFGVAGDIGSVTPGRFGDVILLDGPLPDVNVSLTIAAGQVVAENGRMTAEWPTFQYPASARETIRVGRELTPADLKIPAPISSGTLRARVIEPIENHAETRERIAEVTAVNGEIRPEMSSGLCKIAVFERHFASGGKAVGLLGGIGLDRSAGIAMTVAHDCHNLLVIGNDDQLMADAANLVIGSQGGIAVLGAGEPVLFPLPVAGLMSDADLETVAEQSRAVGQALKGVGCTMNSALMTLSLLALVVIPELRLSDKGLVRISSEGIGKVSLFPDYTS